MKNFNNKTTGINVSAESDENTTFAALAAACVNNIPEGGLDVNEMSMRLKLKTKLENGGKTIKFEDAEVVSLKNCVEKMRWLIMHEDVVAFLEHVKNL